MFIVGLGTAVPPRRYTQRECWDALQDAKEFSGLTSRSQTILRKVLTGANGIATRHLALGELREAFELDPDALQSRFLTHAPRLATRAAERALADAEITGAEVDALLISTCTGYLCPGLTSYVGENLGLRPEILALDLVGQGCGAALPNLRAAEALLLSGRARRVLSVCVEVCSAAFYLDDDPGVLISACLFGDGAGAAVLAAQPNRKRRIEWKLGDSLLEPANRNALRFEQRRGMLRNVLAPEVPRLAAAQTERVVSKVLNRGNLRRAELKGWVFHPGGREVLSALRDRIGLSEFDLRWSADILSQYGNLSSPSVFFVLEAALADSGPAGPWLMASFGAGFSCHGALLELE